MLLFRGARESSKIGGLLSPHVAKSRIATCLSGLWFCAVVLADMCRGGESLCAEESMLVWWLLVR